MCSGIRIIVPYGYNLVRSRSSLNGDHQVLFIDVVSSFGTSHFWLASKHMARLIQVFKRFLLFVKDGSICLLLLIGRGLGTATFEIGPVTMDFLYIRLYDTILRMISRSVVGLQLILFALFGATYGPLATCMMTSSQFFFLISVGCVVTIIFLSNGFTFEYILYSVPCKVLICSLYSF